MRQPLLGPDGRYRLQIEVLASQDGRHFSRHEAADGFVLGPSFLVAVDEVCTLLLVPGESGLTLRDLRLADTCQLRVFARVTPGPAPPDWLPTEATYLLFDGDRLAAAAQVERYVPFDGVAGPDTWAPGDQAPLDVLAVALGRTVSRANARLAAEGSVLSCVTLRVGVERIDLGPGRVFLALDQTGGAAAQYVQLTLRAGHCPQEEETPS